MGSELEDSHNTKDCHLCLCTHDFQSHVPLFSPPMTYIGRVELVPLRSWQKQRGRRKVGGTELLSLSKFSSSRIPPFAQIFHLWL